MSTFTVCSFITKQIYNSFSSSMELELLMGFSSLFVSTAALFFPSFQSFDVLPSSLSTQCPALTSYNRDLVKIQHAGTTAVQIINTSLPSLLSWWLLFSSSLPTAKWWVGEDTVPCCINSRARKAKELSLLWWGCCCLLIAVSQSGERAWWVLKNYQFSWYCA